MKWQIHNIYGWIHVVSSLVAMITSVYVLLNIKGNKWHIRIGYVYFISMVLLNISSFGVMLQNNGKPGIFHVGAIVSLIYTFRGIIPAYTRKTKDWLRKHYFGMSGSVIGLYAAFFVEIGFRSFNTNQAALLFTIGMTVMVTIIGTIIIRTNAKKYFKAENK